MSINWPSLVASWFVVQKIFSKMHLVLCTNTYHDVIDLVNHGMVKNTKTWISWERNIIFLRNKKILNLCFRWHILSYCLVAEVTFKTKLSVATVNNSFQLLPISCYKELHLSCCRGLELYILTWSIEITPSHDQVQPWENMKNVLP